MTMTEDLLHASVGFHHIETFKKHLNTLYQPTVSLDNTLAGAILDTGFYATLRKKDRYTNPVP